MGMAWVSYLKAIKALLKLQTSLKSHVLLRDSPVADTISTHSGPQERVAEHRPCDLGGPRRGTVLDAQADEDGPGSAEAWRIKRVPSSRGLRAVRETYPQAVDLHQVHELYIVHAATACYGVT